MVDLSVIFVFLGGISAALDWYVPHKGTRPSRNAVDPGLQNHGDS